MELLEQRRVRLIVAAHALGEELPVLRPRCPASPVSVHGR